MDRHRTVRRLAATFLGAMLVGCSGARPPEASPAPSIAVTEPPVTLRLAVSNDHGIDRPYADELARQVAERSAGRITIVPLSTAGESAGDAEIIPLLLRGEAELSVTATRTWDLHGETSLRALQAPFLIDGDALALEVATSDIARRALDGMTGVVGLTLWPAELRHFQTFEACDNDFRTPDGMRGSAVWMAPSGVSRSLLEALGATEFLWPPDADRGADAHACRVDGVEASITNLGVLPMGEHPIAVGDVVVFPKYLTITANRDTFERLTSGQQGVLRDAATAVQRVMLDAYQRDEDAAAVWCANGGGVILAGGDAPDAFRKAAVPVYDRLEQDPLTAALIADLRELAAASADPGRPKACRPAAGPAVVPPDDLTGYRGTLPPDGVYRRQLIADELVANGVSEAVARANAGLLTATYDHGRTTLVVEQGGQVYRCEGTYETDGRSVHATTSSGPGPCEFTGDFLWRPEANGGLSFVVAPFAEIPAEDRALLDHWVWTRIG